jgi:ERCC4-type nuclease
MYLLIDYREQDFIKRLSDYCIIENDMIKEFTLNNVEIKFKITNLPISDFIILDDIEDNNTIRLAIERKSIRDLCSSITDGRFREQKQRLLDSINDVSKVCYLIEGTKNINNSDKLTLSNTIINGSLLNLIFKHKYKLIQTENKIDTFNNIILLYKKFKNNDFENQGIQNKVKLIKRSDKIKDNKILNQLCLIPGVSSKVAEIIIKNVNLQNINLQNINLQNDNLQNDNLQNIDVSIKSLIDIYKLLNDETECENYFSEVIVSNNDKKVRKIGKALSKKIYEYFCK